MTANRYCIRAAREWGIATVAVDRSSSRFWQMKQFVLALVTIESYLNINAVLSAAVDWGRSLFTRFDLVETTMCEEVISVYRAHALRYDGG